MNGTPSSMYSSIVPLAFAPCEQAAPPKVNRV